MGYLFTVKNDELSTSRSVEFQSMAGARHALIVRSEGQRMGWVGERLKGMDLHVITATSF